MRPSSAHTASRARRIVTRAVAEPLEARRLLAYAAAEYFPLGGGNVWDYVGTVDGASTVAHVVSTIDDGRTRLNLTTGQSAAAEGSTHYSLDASLGLKLHEIDTVGDDASAKVTFNPGLRVLNVAAAAGDVIAFDDVETRMKVHDDVLGELDGTGTTNGAAEVIGIERVSIRDDRFVDALKITVTLDFDLTGFRTTGWNFDGTYTSTWWLGAGIGMVKSEEAIWIKVDAPAYDVSETGSSSAALTLTGSSLLPPDLDALAGGVLTLDGTEAGDRIAVTSAGGQIVSTRGGVSKAYATTDVNTINVITRGGNDVVTVGPGVIGVYVDAGAGNDLVTGGDGPDTLTGGAGKDRLDGAAGNDRVAGNGGHDNLVGNVGDDRLYGANENDTMEGGSGIDRLWGGAGDDVLAGNGSNDKLFGEDGNDILSGGTQNDLLNGGAGGDSLFGGDGSDTFTLADSFIDTADGGAEVDLLATSDSNDVLSNI